MNRKTNNGFSMIEMMVTFTLVAAMAGLAIGVFRSTASRQKFTSSVNQFVADFSYARQLASRLNRYVAIEFDKNGTFYTILTQDKTGDTVNFSEHKRIYPLAGDEAFEAEKDLTVNSMGMVRVYPLTATADLATITINFFQKNKGTSIIKYKRTVIVNPSGGIKLQNEPQ